MEKPAVLLTDEQYLEMVRLLDVCPTAESAAKALDAPVEDIEKILDAYPELRALTGELEPPRDAKEAEENAAKHPLTPLKRGPEGVAERKLREQDDLLVPVLEGLGMSPRLAERMRKFRDYGRDHFSDVRQMVGGNMAMTLAQLTHLRDQWAEQLADPSTSPEERAILLTQLDVILEHLHKTGDRAQQASLIEARIKAVTDAERIKKQQRRSAKPGFSPLVAISANSVRVSEAPAKHPEREQDACPQVGESPPVEG